MTSSTRREQRCALCLIDHQWIEWEQRKVNHRNVISLEEEQQQHRSLLSDKEEEFIVHYHDELCNDVRRIRR